MSSKARNEIGSLTEENFPIYS